MTDQTPSSSHPPADGGSAIAPISDHGSGSHGRVGFWALTIGSIGVVYGDIGTSPLYAFKEAMVAAVGHHGQSVLTEEALSQVSRDAVVGVTSLILWVLILIVTIKYVTLLLRADDRGEGGILTLMALANRAIGRPTRIVTLLGIFGAALFYGDAIITPAMTVLSSIEGIKLVTPAFDQYIIPITCTILIFLFFMQSQGTARVARFFGPIMVLWFLTMGLCGLLHISDDFSIFYAFNPYYGIKFAMSNGKVGLFALGAVFLAVTGGEALYADMGHFGRKPIQMAWLGLIFPSLILNYLGQGAMVIHNPRALENPFFLLAPSWALVPLVVLATLASIIASQSVITGAYSLSRQAIQLGLLPRMQVKYTSESHSGQIYMPFINWMLLIGVLLLVLTFKNSSNLASAYGIAVTGTMTTTSILTFLVLRYLWKWSLLATLAIMMPLIMVESIFLFANMLKIFDGGWVPLMIGMVMLVVVLTWQSGSRILAEKTRRIEVPLGDLVKSLEKRSPHRVSGTAVFLTGDLDYAPTSLLHNLKHNKVLHESNVLLQVKNADAPRVPESERVRMVKLNDHFSTITLRFGYMETPHIPRALKLCRQIGWKFEIMSSSFFLSRRHLRASGKMGMPLWQDHLFIAMALNANSATDYFHLPTDRVVEVGTQVTI